MNKLPPDEYLKKPYTRILFPEEEGGFSAEILEFPGCFAEGETANETYEALERVAKSWIEAAQEQGQTIPEPFNNQGYGGKVALRMPRSIHRQAAKMAERDSTSLNQFLLAAISTRIGAEDVYVRIAERLQQQLATTISRFAFGFATYLQDVSNIKIDIMLTDADTNKPAPKIAATGEDIVKGVNING